MKIPFGKYKDISSIPISYIRWLHENVDLDRWGLRHAVERCLGIKQQAGAGLEERVEKLEEENKELKARLQEAVAQAWEREKMRRQFQELQAKFKTAYRQLALRFHPDRGGSHEDMGLINELLSV